MASLSTPTWRGHAWPDWVTLLARLILGGVLLVAGAIKVPDLEGSARSVRNFKIFSFEISGVIGYALPFIEILLGLLLIIGLFTRIAAVLGALMMLAYIIGIASVWARGLSIDCGCFGNGAELEKVNPVTYALDIARDVGLFLCGAWAAWHPRSPFSAEHALFGDPIIIDEE